MADQMLVRFDDKTAQEVRERARAAGKSITAFLNEAVRAYLDLNAATAEVEHGRLARFAIRFADAANSIERMDDGTQLVVRDALKAIVDCLELIPIQGEIIDDPVTWEQYKYSKLNQKGDESEARRMFAKDYQEIELRPWTWYRAHYDSDDAAKAAWLRQRRRFGLPAFPQDQNTARRQAEPSIAGHNAPGEPSSSRLTDPAHRA